MWSGHFETHKILLLFLVILLMSAVKMVKKRMSNAIKIVNNLFLPSRMVGLFPFQEQYDTYVISKMSLFISVILCLLISMVTFSFIVVQPPIAEEVQVAFQFDYINIVISAIIPVLSLYNLYSSIHILNEKMKLIDQIQKYLLKIGRHTLLTSINCSLWKGFILAVFSLMFRFINDFLYKKHKIALMSSLEVLYYTMLLCQTYILVQRYAVLINLLNVIFHGFCKAIAPDPLKEKSVPEKVLEILVRSHSQLSSAAVAVSEGLMPHIFFIIVSCFVEFVQEAHKTISSLHSRNISYSIFFYLTKLSTMGASLHIILIIINACVNCTNQAKEFNTLLYQLMIDDKTNELANNKKLRLHISMKREVVFTACGFFTLDYTLVHSMIAAATTYLVILIQFGENGSTSNTTTTEFPTTAIANTTLLDISEYITTPVYSN